MTHRLLCEWSALYRSETPETLARALHERLATSPRCPLARYLLGCICFDRGRPARGVRHMMVAHHVEPDLESAALLVFAGLNACHNPERSLLDITLETWDAHRRPPFDRRRRERALLDAFAMEHEPDSAAYSPLARSLLRIPIRPLRHELQSTVAAGVSESIASLLLPTTTSARMN